VDLQLGSAADASQAGDRPAASCLSCRSAWKDVSRRSAAYFPDFVRTRRRIATKVGGGSWGHLLTRTAETLAAPEIIHELITSGPRSGSVWKPQPCQRVLTDVRG
jgi:hypothetical protein